MLDFVLKYWIEVLFGAVVAVGSFVIKRTLKSYEMERKREKEDFLKTITAKINEEFDRSNKEEKKLQEEVKVIKFGLLSVQGRNFKANCRRLLQPEHKITLEEFEEITKDHDAYNSLGGNHTGDQLYELVRNKVEENWTTDKASE